MNIGVFLGVLSGAILSGTSILYVSLGEIVGERSGIVNLGLEGIMLVCASVSFLITYETGSPYLGLIGAIVAGGILNLFFGLLVVTFGTNQLASGLALMFFGFGLSSLIGNSYVGRMIKGLDKMSLPFLQALPKIQAHHFRYDLLVFLAAPIAVLIWWLLFHTKWGLGVRAVGEDPNTAYSSGRNPVVFKYQALILCGLLTGLGAAHLSIAWTLTWSEHMTAGRGFIAIALVVFANWHPVRAIFGALLFGGGVAFQLFLQAAGVSVSPFLLDIIPYILPLIVLSIWGGKRRSSAPASLGRLYKGAE